MRIHKLKLKIAELGALNKPESENCPPELEEQFLRYVVEYEKAPDTTNALQIKAVRS